jgi:hypothetical protein
VTGTLLNMFGKFLILVGAVLTLVPPAFSQAGGTGGMGLNPARVEVEMKPGEERTVSFDIEAPPSDVRVQGRLLLSLTDWTVNDDGSMRFADVGTLPQSASEWTVFSPSAVSISSGQTQLVRVTVRVPKTTKPGVYRAGIFVQERPPAAAPGAGQHVVYLRFRYVFSMYVIVQPVARAAELIGVGLDKGKDGWNITYDVHNIGSRHLRPLVSWSIANSEGKEVAAAKRQESMVLLPQHNLRQAIPVELPLPSGEYEVYAEVDFQDGRPLQAMRRKISLDEPVDVAKQVTDER